MSPQGYGLDASSDDEHSGSVSSDLGHVKLENEHSLEGKKQSARPIFAFHPTPGLAWPGVLGFLRSTEYGKLLTVRGPPAQLEPTSPTYITRLHRDSSKVKEESSVGMSRLPKLSEDHCEKIPDNWTTSATLLSSATLTAAAASRPTIRDVWTLEVIARFKTELDASDPEGRLIRSAKAKTLDSIPQPIMRQEDYPEMDNEAFKALHRREWMEFQKQRRLLDIAKVLVLIEDYDDLERRLKRAISRKIEAQHPE